jgi:acyl-CoA thioesterase FadM
VAGDDPRFVVDIVAPDAGHGRHVANQAIDEIFFDTRNDYLRGLGVDDIWTRQVQPQIREALIRFDSEVMPGDQLRCAVWVASRSRRAFVIEQTLATAQGRMVATCRSVWVGVDTLHGGAAAVPDDLWAAIEIFEGRQIAMTGAAERTGPDAARPGP